MLGGEWSASRPRRFTLGERTASSHLIGDWVGLRAGLDAVAMRKFLSPSRESSADRQAHCLVAVPTELFCVASDMF